MKVAIAGASGLTGGLTLQRLLAADRISEVWSIGRKSLGISHPKLHEVLLVNSQLTSPIKVDAFISCLGTTIKKAGSQAAFQAVDLELPIHLTQKLKEQGCETGAYVSAMGANSNSKIFYNRTKGQMENQIRSLGLKSATFLRPSLILGARQESRPMERLGVALVTAIEPFMQGPLKNLSGIQADTIAAALVRSCLEPKAGVKMFLSGEIKAFALGVSST